jgi:hypothetical protein
LILAQAKSLRDPISINKKNAAWVGGVAQAVRATAKKKKKNAGLVVHNCHSMYYSVKRRITAPAHPGISQK